MYSIIEKRNERIRVEKIWKMFSIWICFRLKKKEILAFRSNSVRGWTIRGESVCSAGGLQSRFRRDKQKKNGCAIRGEARRCLMSPQTSLSLDNHRLMHVPTPCFFFFFFFFFVILEYGSEGTRKRNFVNFSRPSWDGLMETVGVYREQHRSVGSEREGLNFLKCKVCMFSLSLFNYDWYFRSLASLPLPSFFFSYRNLRGVIFKRKGKKV